MMLGTTTASTTTAAATRRLVAQKILSSATARSHHSSTGKLLLSLSSSQSLFHRTCTNASSPLILRAVSGHGSLPSASRPAKVIPPPTPFTSVRLFSTPSTPGSHHHNDVVARAKSTAVSFDDFIAPKDQKVVIDHHESLAQHPGVIEKPLRALDMSMVRQIKAELMSVDVNADGRLDATELKQLLRKHTDAFTDEEIVEIGELYYAAKAGGSVRFDNFIEAVDRVAANSLQLKQQQQQQVQEQSQKEVIVDLEEKIQHFHETQRHPLGVGRDVMEFWEMGKSHGHYTSHELDVKLTHVPPVGFRDRLAYQSVRAIRFLFDSATGWRSDNITTANTLNRVIYLETIAAVPGMVAAIIRHFRSLRTMKGDGGMLQMFLEEANNERMHLLTFVRMKDPGYLFRGAVILGQFGFGSLFTMAYIVSPKFCHRFVGYVEEEACSTYTKIIKAIETAPEGSDLAKWRTEHPPRIACAYWKLGTEGTVLDLMKAVRADEAEHRDVNHLVSGMREGQINPLYDPEAKLDIMLGKYVKAIMTRDSKDDIAK